jgi:chromosome segregation ATPase
MRQEAGPVFNRMRIELNKVKEIYDKADRAISKATAIESMLHEYTRNIDSFCKDRQREIENFSRRMANETEIVERCFDIHKDRLCDLENNVEKLEKQKNTNVVGEIKKIYCKIDSLDRRFEGQKDVIAAIWTDVTGCKEDVDRLSGFLNEQYSIS